MFVLFVIIFCLVQFANSHLLDGGMWHGIVLSQLELVIVLGAAAFKTNTMRDRAVMDVLFIWSIWIIATDWLPYFPPIIASVESSALACLVVWVYFRPYHYTPMPVFSENVCIAFYGGPNAPFLSRIAALAGFPFASIAIIAAGSAIRPSKATGKMVKTDRGALSEKGYIVIDTGIKMTPEIIGKMNGIVGTSTGYGIFRTKCLTNLIPVLRVLGDEWMPKSMFKIPTFFYYQCVRNVS